MKRHLKFLSIPLSLWTHPDLSIEEKAVMIEIDSCSETDKGASIGAQSIATSLGIPIKQVKRILKSLLVKGAISITIGEDGERRTKVYLYCDRYVSNPNSIELGDSPTDEALAHLDYSFIQSQWNHICHMLPKLERFTPQRKLKTRTCLKKAGATTDDLIKVFKLISTSSFLKGSKTDWKCSFDWIIKSPDNFTKILEGNYHSKNLNEERAYREIMNGIDQKLNKQDDDNIYR